MVLMLHVLMSAVSGPKQSALALQEWHAPAVRAPAGSVPVVFVTNAPLILLQRWYTLPEPALTVDVVQTEPPEAQVQLFSIIEAAPGEDVVPKAIDP